MGLIAELDTLGRDTSSGIIRTDFIDKSLFMYFTGTKLSSKIVQLIKKSAGRVISKLLSWWDG